MAIVPKLDLRQSQNLVMTPQLQQAIKLLQLSNLELTAFVEEELQRNPLLEHAEAEVSAERQGEMEAMPEATPAADRDASLVGLDRLQPEKQSELQGQDNPLDTDIREVSDNDTGSDAAPTDYSADMGISNFYGGGGSGAFYDNGKDFGVEQTADEQASLKEHLLQQLNVDITDPTELLIGAEIIEQLDEAGYLTESLDNIADRLGAHPAQLRRLLKRLQRFEPTGVFARDLAECLELQLRELDRFDPAMAALVENLELLAKYDLEKLIPLCGVDQEDMLDMIAELKALNPKPGLAHHFEVAQAVVPDVFVRESPSGGWSVELNTETLPRILVNNRYYAEINEKTKSKKDKAYITECMATANWLTKSLDQRARTILKVSSEIVRQQDGFLARGVSYLRPLNLRTIAEAIEMHESTVSRVTSNKYMSTHRGVFELKYFFSSSISGASGEDAHSAEAVRHKIRELIGLETAKTVLSDDKLVEALNTSGIVIARRTVAKYREALGIPSSVQRRRQIKMRI